MVKLNKPAIDVGIVTDNEQVMIAFYTEFLGLPLVDETQLGAVGRIFKIQCGESLIKLFRPAAGIPRKNASRGYLNDSGLRYLTIHVADLNAIIAACKKNDVTVVTDIVEPRPGVKAALIADPDSNTLELMETEASDM